jgi:hypothetical protein
MASYKEMKKDLKTAKNASLFNGQASKSPEEFFHLEVKLTDHEKSVVEMLKLVADGTWKTNDKFLNTVGELYHTIRMGLKEYLPYVDDRKNIGEEKKDKKNKADQIREKNVLEKVKDSVTFLEQLMQKKMWKLIPSTQSDLIETRLLAMMYHLSQMSKHAQDQSQERLYDLSFGCAKILSSLKTLQVKHKQNGHIQNISETQIVKNFEEMYKKYLQTSEFDVLEAANSYPKLFIKTSYDNILPGMSMSPYTSQLEVMDLVKTNKKNGCLLWLNTLTGEGKTSLIVAIAKWALNLRTYRDKDLEKPEVIYCCSEKLKAIRQQVGQYSWNAALPFGIATMDAVVDHPSYCKKECPRILTIADVETTIHLLTENEKIEKNKKNYILFFDEPTFTLDRSDSEMIGYLSELFKVMPKITILSTATAPDRDQIPRLEQIFKGMYPESIIHFVKSMRVLIGSEIADFSGDLYLPHSGCETYEEYKKVLEKIDGNGFLQKCYTANVVNGIYVMLTRLSKKYGFAISVDFKTYMENTSNMNQQAIQRLGLSYLKNVEEICNGYNDSKKRDELVKVFCKVVYKKDSIDFNNLCTNYGMFENQTLIVTSNPLSFFDTHFSGYMLNIEKELGKSFADMYKEYQKNILLFLKEKEEKLEELEKSLKGKSADERDKAYYDKITELEQYRPRLNFDEKYIIGSKRYYNYNNEDDEVKRREYIPIERLELDDLSCQDKHQLGLVIGVGILSKEMSPSYFRKVSELSLKGLLAYVIADEDICYGTNYPIENVIVDECLKDHSVKTIFQVFARAGRPGKSWRASIFTHPSILSKIREYVFDKGYVDVETVHMNLALDRVEIKEIVKNESVQHIQNLQENRKKTEENIVCDSWEDEI